MCAACCRLTALVTPAGVRWNRRLGSYDDPLAPASTAVDESAADDPDPPPQ